MRLINAVGPCPINTGRYIGRAAACAGGVALARPKGAAIPCEADYSPEPPEPPDTAEPAGPIPKIRLGQHDISRLIVGANPFYGYSFRYRLGLLDHVDIKSWKGREVDLRSEPGAA